MLNKKEIRPAATGTEIMNEVFGNPHKNYITSKTKKQVVSIIFLALILAVLTVWAVQTEPELVPIEHKVTSGETLTSIIYKYKPDDFSFQKYREWVFDHNKSGMIYPGDTVIMAEVVR